MIRHDALLDAAYTALAGDRSAPAEAVRAVLLVHISHPAPETPEEFTCAVCVGTGQGLVDGCWVHCCCPVCSCGEPVCGDGCETVEAIADALGIVVNANIGGGGRG